MILPKIHLPTIELTIPSTEKKTTFVPFRGAEEKILLMAKQSGKDEEILRAIKQVINNCSQDPTFDINKIALFDIEYLYLKLHAASITNIIHLILIDKEDEQEYKFDINLDEVEVKGEKKNGAVKIDDNVTIILEYPSSALYGDKTLLESEFPLNDLAIRCIKEIHQGENTIDIKNVPLTDLEKWFSTFSVRVMNEIREFFNTMPVMEYELDYTNTRGTEQKFYLRTLRDFFLL